MPERTTQFKPGGRVRHYDGRRGFVVEIPESINSLIVRWDGHTGNVLVHENDCSVMPDEPFRVGDDHPVKMVVTAIQHHLHGPDLRGSRQRVLSSVPSVPGRWIVPDNMIVDEIILERQEDA